MPDSVCVCVAVCLHDVRHDIHLRLASERQRKVETAATEEVFDNGASRQRQAGRQTSAGMLATVSLALL